MAKETLQNPQVFAKKSEMIFFSCDIDGASIWLNMIM